jgi:hypothetical protein
VIDMQHVLVRIALTAAFLTTALLAAAGPVAASRSLSLAPAGNFTAIASGLLSLRFVVSGIPTTVTCSTQMSGTLARTTAKVVSSQLGAVTLVRTTLCSDTLGMPTTVDANSLIGTGWRLRYTTFAGTLPNPSRLDFRIEPIAFAIDIGGVIACLLANSAGSGSGSIGFRGSAPNTSGLFTFNGATLVLFSGSGCSRASVAALSFSLTPRQTLLLLG